MREKGWDEGCSAEGGKETCDPSPQPLSHKGRGTKPAPRLHATALPPARRTATRMKRCDAASCLV
ncbi:hypothetical protein EJ913_19105 [Azospirillum doebereinerae]|uniref:Uncharacterized protein n=1 Tax=Azospirillum doebereinerae TaxID=92933 RepID=A0A3S0XL27_9PROT|nr:hypothetical protein EJ913_19105 [Azospirillum doebereinerae]